MSQRGFTLLEMMLVLLLIGVSASMVLLAFPSARTQEATQILARFQAQLDFVRERGQQTGQQSQDTKPIGQRLAGSPDQPEGATRKLQQIAKTAPVELTGGLILFGCVWMHLQG